MSADADIFCTDLEGPVAALMKAGAQHPIVLDRDTPQSILDLRTMLQYEEVDEADEAMHHRMLPELAKELADIIVVAVGTALQFRIPIAQVYRLVCESNLSKINQETGEAYELSAEGKIKKGPEYVDAMPAITELLRTWMP